ncbi:MAG: hypothetical protein U1C46_11985, partial [Bacteroidales bacterium]|nr:hypothetical protein [Bacteroidales bacterium]
NYDSLETIEDVHNFIAVNSKYLQMITDEFGDIYVEPVLFQNPYRYFANDDKLFQIGDTVYKVLETLTLGAHIDNMQVLMNVNETNYDAFLNDGFVFIFSSVVVSDQSEDLGNNCGTWKEARNTNGRDRTYLRIAVIDENYHGGTNQWTHFIVRPYYRPGLVVWYWCKRTISCDINIATGYYIYNQANTWERVIARYTNPGTLAWSLSGIVSSRWISLGYWATPIAHFDGYDCWGKTPSTGKAELTCNTHLVQ